MKICPVAVAVGCRRCPIFKICPAKSLIGDQAPAKVEPPVSRKAAAPAPRKRSAAKRPAAAGKAKPRGNAR